MHARRQWRKYFFVGVFIVALLNVVAYSVGVVLNLSQSVFFALGMAAGALLMGFLLNYFVPLVDKSKNYRVGAEGEEKVSDYLVDHLNGKNIIVSDVLLDKDKGNIDQVIIGDHGVFVIETKNFRGSYVVDGDDWTRITDKGTISMKSPSNQVKRNSFQLRNFFEKKFVKLKDVYIHNIVVVSNSKIDLDQRREPEYCKIVISVEELSDIINDKKIFRKTKGRNIGSSYIDLRKDDYEKLEDIFLRNSSDVEKSIEFPI